MVPTSAPEETLEARGFQAMADASRHNVGSFIIRIGLGGYIIP